MFKTKKYSWEPLLRIREMNTRRLAQRRAGLDTKTEELIVLGQMKNEALNVNEWIDHYLWQGASEVYLIDNGSDDDSVARARAWSVTKPVHVIELPQPHSQLDNYWRAIKHFGLKKRNAWLLVADLDEFWFSTSQPNIRSLLPKYRRIDVVYTHCKIFGSNGFHEHPQSLRKEITSCMPELAGLGVRKWMVRAEKLKRREMLRVHGVIGLDSSRTTSDTVDLQVNHYVTQSRAFWREVKMRRGDAYDTRMNNARDWKMFEEIERGCTAACEKLANTLP
jgi:hypothetical protein